MVANFDAWLDARVMALADDPPPPPDDEPLAVDEALYDRVRRELDEQVAAETRRRMAEAFANAS